MFQLGLVAPLLVKITTVARLLGSDGLWGARGGITGSLSPRIVSFHRGLGRNIVRNFKELFDQLWDDPYGRIKFNRMERRFAALRRVLHQSVGFTCTVCAENFSWLERFKWNSHRFERG